MRRCNRKCSVADALSITRLRISCLFRPGCHSLRSVMSVFSAAQGLSQLTCPPVPIGRDPLRDVFHKGCSRLPFDIAFQHFFMTIASSTRPSQVSSTLWRFRPLLISHHLKVALTSLDFRLVQVSEKAGVAASGGCDRTISLRGSHSSVYGVD